MADIRTRIELDSIRDMLERMEPESVKAAAVEGLRFGMAEIQRDLALAKMTGQYLGIVTGTARRSIRTRVRTMRDVVVGEVGSPLVYVRAHELGFRGRVTVREHMRDPSDRASHRVRTHTRNVNMRARHFIRDSMRDKSGRVRILLLRSLLRRARQGGGGE